MKNTLLFAWLALGPMLTTAQTTLKVSNGAYLKALQSARLTANNTRVVVDGRMEQSGGNGMMLFTGTRADSLTGKGTIILDTLWYGPAIPVPANSTKLNLGANLRLVHTAQLLAGHLDLGDHVLDLDSTGNLQETNGSYRTYASGNGYVQAKGRALGVPATVNCGTLGLSFSTANDPGLVTIRRRNNSVTLLGSLASIKRTYEIQTSNPFNAPVQADLTIRFDTSELNGNAINRLAVWNSADGQTWTNLGHGLATNDYALHITGTVALRYVTIGLDTVTRPVEKFFRSKTSGNWTNAATWESSPDSLQWSAATRYPVQADSSINIIAGHIVRWTSKDNNTALAHLHVEANGTIQLDSSSLMQLGSANGFQPGMRMEQGSTLSMHLQTGTGAGVGNDLIKVLAFNGPAPLQLNGTLQVFDSSTVPDGAYTIIRSQQGITGKFTSTSLPAGYTLQYFGGAGNAAGIIDSVMILKANATSKPNLSIVSPPAQAEGNSGTTDLKFEVHLNTASTSPISVYYNTLDSTATAGSDYVATSGWLKFAPGQVSDTIRVPILGDRYVEPNEQIKVRLSLPLNANITTPQAFGTIRNDDAYPNLTFTNYTVKEGDLIDTTVRVQVKLTSTYPDTIRVNYTTADSTATAGSDYIPSAGALTFNPGDSLAFIPVTIKGDLIVEPNEIVKIVLSGAVKANLPVAPGRILIANDDTYPVASSPNLLVNEGSNDAFNPVKITVRLSKPYPLPVTLRYRTTDSTATAGSDYLALSGVMTIAAGDTLGTLGLSEFGDRIVEPTEYIKFVLDSATNAAAPSSATIISLNNDDAYPSISVTGVTVTEGDQDTVMAAVQVKLSSRYPLPVTVQLATSDITAWAGADYVSVNQQLNFPADGDTVQTVNIRIIPDLIDENDETLNVQLTNAVNGLVSGTGTALVNIIDNDPVPALHISDTSATEAAGVALVKVELTQASGKQVKVPFSTLDGSAKAGLDYTTIKGDTLVFQPGETQQYIHVAILTDAITEADETFSVVLGSPTNGSITAAGSRATATVTIQNSPAASRVTVAQSPLDEVPLSLSLVAMPNPSNGVIHLQVLSATGAIVHIKVSDLSGRIIESQDHPGGSMTLDLGETWRSGVYVAEVTQGDRREIIRLIRL